MNALAYGGWLGPAIFACRGVMVSRNVRMWATVEGLEGIKFEMVESPTNKTRFHKHVFKRHNRFNQ